MSKLSRQAIITIDRNDLCEMLSESLCAYNVLGGLEVSYVEVNDDGDFVVTLIPKKPADEAEGRSL